MSLLGTDWRINPIVLQVEWWFDGKHCSSLNHMKSTAGSLYLFSSCLQRVTRATRLVSDSSCARRRLTYLSSRSRWIILYTVSRWIPVSHMISIGAFWIVFLPEHKVFDILSVLADTHTRSATARLPINRIYPLFGFSLTVSTLPHFEQLLWDCLTDTWI